MEYMTTPDGKERFTEDIRYDQFTEARRRPQVVRSTMSNSATLCSPPSSLLRSALRRKPADPVAPFLGTWSGVFTTQEHEYWTFTDIQCFVGCTQDFYDRLSKLLADPANDALPAMALSGQANGRLAHGARRAAHASR